VEKSRAGRAQAHIIPNKLYFRIGEVSDLIGVKPYVLRYWESEFPDIKPSKSKSGQRLYKRRDVELLLRIKELLYEERFTINGARKRLKDFGRADDREGAAEALPDVEEEIEEEGPRQLDVFAMTETAPGDAEAPQASGRGSRAGASREGSKTLLKIRRDLEELLAMMKA
jgi:DNA-binding transcriptional MerR regulator